MIVNTQGPHAVLESEPRICEHCGGAIVHVLIATPGKPVCEWRAMERPGSRGERRYDHATHYRAHACGPAAAPAEASA